MKKSKRKERRAFIAGDLQYEDNKCLLCKCIFLFGGRCEELKETQVSGGGRVVVAYRL
jgi:hypothetical protein